MSPESFYCKPCMIERSRQRRLTKGPVLKAEAFAAYGGKCVVCGSALDLCIDHIFGRTPEDDYLGMDLYAFLKKRGWPKDRYQLLCVSCNSAKG